jgi:hypothetical protein
MSQLGITTDLLINRTSWTAELRAAETDVKSLAQRLAASPLKIPAVLSIDATKLRAAIAAAQTMANANPITIPVTYGCREGGWRRIQSDCAARDARWWRRWLSDWRRRIRIT